jgi:hypothetical protein
LWVPGVTEGSQEEKAAHAAREKARLEEEYRAIQGTSEGKIRDATILAASRAQAQVAALRRVQKARAEHYQKLRDSWKDAKYVNSVVLDLTLSDLKGAENMLDELAIRKLEMEMTWAHLGTVIYELSAFRAGELKTVSAFDDLADRME